MDNSVIGNSLRPPLERIMESPDRNNEDIRTLAGKLLTVQDDERRRSSRDLHDDVNQRLGAIGLQLDSLCRRLPDAPATVWHGNCGCSGPHLTGRDVQTIQRVLRRTGHRLTVDGHYGPETDVAVTRFQRKHGLEPDSIVGPRTWKALVGDRR